MINSLCNHKYDLVSDLDNKYAFKSIVATI